ncbi:helix-turn-helix domain-containing protein [Streptomyces sp. PpalLS-921]|uniref:helix-turn-helix domain-containing protein n=1 Tax=Streptomyces sp. PpalLS-921 TaxID=1839772 RepID=UPI00081F37FA|nr:helix-turn-helix transcriptional regulator [Streptomyces sp. PpalLS-921]SCD61393.1 Transcriptional regulator, contains XRE-family HTH domain [Streptomyces sp. PpalLS-921]
MAARPLEIGEAGVYAGLAIARLREARGWDQQGLAERLSVAGRQVSQPIVSRMEAGTRRIDIDDLVTVADVLGVSVVALLPLAPAAPAPVAAAVPARSDDAGPVEAALADDIEALGDLQDMEPTHAAVAFRLARQMDGMRPVACEECGATVQVPNDPRTLPQLARELRATVAALVKGRAVDDDDDDDLGDLGAV